MALEDELPDTEIAKAAIALARERNRGVSTVEVFEAAMQLWTNEPTNLRDHLISNHALGADDIAEATRRSGDGARLEPGSLEPGLEAVLSRASGYKRQWSGPKVDDAFFTVAALASNPATLAGQLMTARGAVEELASISQNLSYPKELLEALNNLPVNPKEMTMAEQAAAANPDSKTPVLDSVSRDITAQARANSLPPVVGRNEEIWDLMDRLGVVVKPNVMLLGDPGVGKTAIVEGLAQKIASGQVPANLRDKRIVSLDLGLLSAGTSMRGEFEEKVSAILKEIKEDGNVILFLDEIHTMVGAGGQAGAQDLAQMLKPALSRGELQFIGATTYEEYRKRIANDGALDRRLQQQMVDELDKDAVHHVLTAWAERLTDRHGVVYSEESVADTQRLADRYIRDKNQPDKGIDILDFAGSRARTRLYQNAPQDIQDLNAEVADLVAQRLNTTDEQARTELQTRETELNEKLQTAVAEWGGQVDAERPVVGEVEIAEAVHVFSRVPVAHLLEDQTTRLINMEGELHKRVVGQVAAVQAVSQTVRRSNAGLSDPHRPTGSFIFLGPTGVGKTELGKAVAEFLFDDEAALLRFDMSEYMEKHTAARLTGAPPGYVGYDEGGQLTEAVRRRPFSVLLFDEIEKAHPDVFNTLLQLLDDGRLTDGQGRTIDFTNTVVIMTTNLVTDTKEVKKGRIGFGPPEAETAAAPGEPEDVERKALLATGFFRPEFVNRVDEVIRLLSLTEPEIRQIVDLQVSIRSAMLRESKGVGIEFSEAAREQVAKVGYDPTFGARPLKRAMNRVLDSDELTSDLLKGVYRPGDTIKVDFDPKVGWKYKREVGLRGTEVPLVASYPITAVMEGSGKGSSTPTTPAGPKAPQRDGL